MRAAEVEMPAAAPPNRLLESHPSVSGTCLAPTRLSLRSFATPDADPDANLLVFVAGSSASPSSFNSFWPGAIPGILPNCVERRE